MCIFSFIPLVCIKALGIYELCLVISQSHKYFSVIVLFNDFYISLNETEPFQCIWHYTTVRIKYIFPTPTIVYLYTHDLTFIFSNGKNFLCLAVLCNMAMRCVVGNRHRYLLPVPYPIQDIFVICYICLLSSYLDTTVITLVSYRSSHAHLSITGR